MRTNEQMINSIWNKYYSKEYINDSFFKKNICINNKKTSVLKMIINMFLSIFMTASIVYASYIIINRITEIDVNYSNISRDELINDNYIDITRSLGMSITYDREIYYTIIDDVKKYKDAIRFIPDIIQMDEGNFENEVILVILPREKKNYGLTITSYDVLDDKMIIYTSIEQNEKDVSFIKIPKENIRNNLEFRIDYYIPKVDGLVSIDRLTDYSIDDAKKEECVIIDRRKVVNNKELLDDFMNKKIDNDNNAIRIFSIEYGEETKIRDIEYIDGIYYYALKTQYTEKIVYWKSDVFELTYLFD